MNKSQKEKPNHFIETVYQISESEIKASAKTQCKMEDHKWQKLSENEIYCPICATALIIDKSKMKDYGF